MTKGDGLGALQVGVAGHDSGGILRSLPADDLDEFHDVSLQGVAVVPQGQADIQRHLIVAAAAGVQALACIADAGGQGLLHEGMHILGVGVDLQRTACQIVGNGGQPVEDILAVLFGDDACLASIAAWTPLPRISCAIIRWSKRMEELKSLTRESTALEKRPFQSCSAIIFFLF